MATRSVTEHTVWRRPEDAAMIGRMHGLLGAEPNDPGDTPESCYFASYQRGFAEGRAERERLLQGGRSAEWIAEYVDVAVTGWLDGLSYRSGGAPSPGVREALRRSAVKH